MSQESPHSHSNPSTAPRIRPEQIVADVLIDRQAARIGTNAALDSAALIATGFLCFILDRGGIGKVHQAVGDLSVAVGVVNGFSQVERTGTRQ